MHFSMIANKILILVNFFAIKIERNFFEIYSELFVKRKAFEKTKQT
jgi:hypothetical protein